ncbi:putative reductase [Vibrio vulnificus]|nr:putative reductase [Vibrio vulnificus]
MRIEPIIQGVVARSAHPFGCEAAIKKQIAFVKKAPQISQGPKRVLILGARGIDDGVAFWLCRKVNSGATNVGHLSDLFALSQTMRHFHQCTFCVAKQQNVRFGIDRRRVLFRSRCFI